MSRALAVTAVWAGNSLVNGQVFWALWEWFVTPLGVMHISYWHAFALSLFGSWIGVLVANPPAQSETSAVGSTPILVLVAKTLAMGLILLTAWLIHSYGM